MSLFEIDKFVQNFVQKCVQVIVQSRLGTSKRTQTRCDPHGRDWFYLDIPDLQDITEQTARCLKYILNSTPASFPLVPSNATITSNNSNSSSTNQPSNPHFQQQNSPQSCPFVRKSWKICCEISLRNSDGISLVLEYWILSNVPVGATISSTKSADPSSQQQQTVYQLLNRMSGMLKSLITLSRSTPAYKVSSKGQSADSYVICYRVFPCDEAFIATATNMDTVSSGGSTSSSPSVFSSVKPLGAIKSFCNELSISLIYRTSMSMNFAEEELVNTTNNNNILAALDGEQNCDRMTSNEQQLLPLKDDHFKSVVDCEDGNDYEHRLDPLCDLKSFDVAELFKPLNPAFASFKKESLDDLSNGTPFSALLPPKNDCDEEEAAEILSITSAQHQQQQLSSEDYKENEQSRRCSNNRTSAPISIPLSSNTRGLFSSSPKSAAMATLFSKSPQTGVYSTSNDSFVFVELNAPFASDDREFGSFFHGPSPTFVSNPSLNEESTNSGGGCGSGSSEMINELAQQLAELESNAPQFDSFVESICITESQELKFEA